MLLALYATFTSKIYLSLSRDHDLRSNLGISCGMGVICGLGSFVGQYVSHTLHNKLEYFTLGIVLSNNS